MQKHYTDSRSEVEFQEQHIEDAIAIDDEILDILNSEVWLPRQETIQLIINYAQQQKSE